MNNLIDLTRLIPTPEPTLAASFSPVSLPVPGRPQPLLLRVTAPVDGDFLPIVLLSHGHGPSLYLPSKDGYGPLANFLAERGFVVIQPTQANSKVGGLPVDMPGAPLFAFTCFQARLRFALSSTWLNSASGSTGAPPFFPSHRAEPDPGRPAVTGRSPGVGSSDSSLVRSLIG